MALGGFDGVRYPQPSIEDIELGYRLKGINGRIRLAKEVQVTHLKQWTFTSLLRTDIFDRAIPWLELLAERPQMPNTLNLQVSQRLSVVFVLLSLLHLLLLRPYRWLFWLWLAPISWLNRELYRFFQQERGWLFMLRALPLHWLYYVYSGTAVLLVFGKRLAIRILTKRKT